MIKVKLEDCNNVDSGEIIIRKNTLNIKYGINGTGKSTISRAIELYIKDRKENTNNLGQLTPFKYQFNNERTPKVTGIEDISKVKIFNEEYIKEYMFQKEELVEGSFEILIKNEAYEKGMEEISMLIAEIPILFQENEEIKELLHYFEELVSSFGRAKKGIHGASRFAKALKEGNKIDHIPEELYGYKDFIRSENNHGWIGWQIKGEEFIDISSKCPYCTTDIDNLKAKIRSVSKEYDANSIKHLNNLLSVFKELGGYFSPETREAINKLTTSKSGYTEDEESFLVGIKEQIERLQLKLSNIKNMNFAFLKDVDKVIETINGLKINLDYFNHLKSPKTETKIKMVNEVIESIVARAARLQGEINKQKKLLATRTLGHEKEINQFLTNAGYRYKVEIRDNKKDGMYKLKLHHKDSNSQIENADNHLSFGERNAISLVLFMYDVLSEDVDLVILDDPISSFDANKKYAIIDMLFRKSKSLRDKTVLLLTHDFDPILDMVYHHPDRFSPPIAHFLENNGGILEEKLITRDDIKTFVNITIENIRYLKNDINKLIYLRRSYELSRNKSEAYNLLSNLFHKRTEPRNGRKEDTELMSKEEIKIGTKEIRKYVPEFEYYQFLRKILNDSLMLKYYIESQSNYEKLQLYRIIMEKQDEISDCSGDIFKKFINETFHVDNDYIYQLNPCKYQTIPQFIIDECDKNISKLQKILLSKESAVLA